MELQDLYKNYKKIIGGGGFGIVKTGEEPPYEGIAVKFLYKDKCPNAKLEYLINKAIYSSFHALLKCQHFPNFSVVKPINFVEDGPVSNGFSCAVIMERLRFPINPEYAIHIAVNDIVPPSKINTLIYADKVPRGYFYDFDHIEEIIKKHPFGSIKRMEDVIYRIGLLDGICIFGARILPRDAEYVLSIYNEVLFVTMIDFGMFERIDVTPANYEKIAYNISEAQDDNLYYYPATEGIPLERRNACIDAFMKGMSDAYNCLDISNDASLYNELMNIYSKYYV